METIFEWLLILGFVALRFYVIPKAFYNAADRRGWNKNAWAFWGFIIPLYTWIAYGICCLTSRGEKRG